MFLLSRVAIQRSGSCWKFRFHRSTVRRCCLVYYARLYSTSFDGKNAERGEIDAREEAKLLLKRQQKSPHSYFFVSWKIVGIFGGLCILLYFVLYFIVQEHEKSTLKPGKMYKLKPEQLGLPPQDDVWKDFGGDWDLVSCESGELESSEQFRGSYILLYWGYTNCPDICWEELEKITTVVAELQAEQLPIIPVFISIDPYRDNVGNVKKYIEGISPLLKGFTGTPDQIRKASRKYRIYYMVSGKSKEIGSEEEDSDYLVDHSMRSYFIGPDGKFIKMFLRLDSAKEISRQIRELTGMTPRNRPWWRLLFG